MIIFCMIGSPYSMPNWIILLSTIFIVCFSGWCVLNRKKKQIELKPTIKKFKYLFHAAEDGKLCAGLHKSVAESLEKLNETDMINLITQTLEGKGLISNAFRFKKLDCRKQSLFIELFVQVVRLLNKPHSCDLLVKSLFNKDSIVTVCAARELKAIDCSHIVILLLGTINDNDAYIRKRCVYALGQLKNYLAVDALINALSDKDSGVRSCAAFSLGELISSPSLEVLYGDDLCVDIKSEYKHALSKIKHSLSIALNDDDEVVRQRAEEALKITAIWL